MNNPVNGIDPYGLEFLLIGKGDFYILGKEPYFFRPRALRGPNPARNLPRNMPKETPNPTPRPVNELAPDPIKPGKWGQFLKDLADWLDEAGLGGITDFFNKPESAPDKDDPCENDPEPQKSNPDKEWWDECYRRGLCA